MSQIENNMNIEKAIIIWKFKSGVKTINGILEDQYRDLILERFSYIFKKFISN
jgi:hypothetical protein